MNDFPHITDEEFDAIYQLGQEDLAYELLQYVEADELHREPDNIRAWLESQLGYQLED